MWTNKISKASFAVFLSVALLFVSVCLPVYGTDTDDQIQALRDKSEELQAQIDAAEDEIAALRSDMGQKQEYADELSGQIENLQAQIDVLDQSIDAVQVKIDQLLVDIQEKNNTIAALEQQNAEAQAEIERCEQEIEETYDRLKERLRSLYMNGTLSELELLMSATDFSTYLTTLQLMESMAAHDDALIKSIEEDILNLQELQETLRANQQKVEESKVELEAAKADLEASQAEIEEDKAVVQQAQNQIQSKWDEVQAVISDLDSQSEAYQSLKESYERQLNEAADEIDALIRAQANSGAASWGDGSVSEGGFVWPVQGGGVYTTTEYGQGGHGGLDITCHGASQLTTPIYAAASGTVITATWHSSYGNYIVIDHGNGLTTLYAHCNSISVSVGESVSQNQQIGIVGNTGYSFGAHCHFEVRINGSRTNPRNYL